LASKKNWTVVTEQHCHTQHTRVQQFLGQLYFWLQREDFRVGLLLATKGFQSQTAVKEPRCYWPHSKESSIVHWTAVCYWQHSKDSRVGQLFLSSPARKRKSSRRTKKSSLKNKEQFYEEIVLNLVETEVTCFIINKYQLT
jgi:hypothetical protein